MAIPHSIPALSFVVAVLTTASPALAQYLPPASPPPAGGEQPPTPPTSVPAEKAPSEASAEVSPQAAPRKRWDLLMVLDGVWEQNVGFVTPPGPDDYFGSLRGMLTRFHRSSRSEMRLSAGGAGYLYRDLTSQNRADASAGLYARSELSRRLTGRLNGNYTYGHSDNLPFVESGVLLPLERAETGLAAGGMTWRTSERMSLSLDGGWSGYWFASEELVDTEIWRGAASLARRLSAGETMDLRLEYTRNWQSGGGREESTWDNPALTLGYTGLVSRRLVFELRAGGSRSFVVTGSPANAPPQWGLEASVGLSGRIKRASIAAHLQHGLRPTVALGLRERSSTLNLSLTVPIGRAVELLTRGTVSLRQDIDTPGAGQDRDGDTYVGAAVRLAARIRAVVGYRFRYRDWPSLGGVARNNRASLSLVCGEGLAQ